MANEENLKNGESTQFRTGEEQAKIAQKGGKASGKARRRKKALRQAAAAILGMSVSESQVPALVKQRLREFGYEEEEATFQDAMLVGVMMKAIKGDVGAATFLRDTAGENPSLGMRKEELKLRKEDLKLKKESLLGGEKNDRDENNLLDAIKGVEEVDTSDLPEVE